MRHLLVLFLAFSLPSLAAAGVPSAAGATVFTCGISVDGISFGGRTSYSPDQNGDLVVDLTDVALADSLLGTSTPTMDLDCSGGIVDGGDMALVLAHQGHECHCPVPTRRTSWGKMKTLYR